LGTFSCFFIYYRLRGLTWTYELT